MKKILFLLSAALAGCGGGGESTSSYQVKTTSTPTVVPTVVPTAIELAPKPLFETTPSLLPNLREKYDLLCGSNVSVQNAIPIDFNNDGKKDLLFNLWCRRSDETYYGPTVNSLVALIQLSDGSFVDRTKEIFGSDIVDIGGVGYGYIIADFNGDSYNDIVFAVNREDGRGGPDPTAQMAETVSLMSDVKGHYSQIKFGLPKWGGDVRVIKDSKGKDMALIIPSGYSNAEVWSFNGTWSQVTNYSWLKNNPVTLGSALVNKFDNGIKLELWNFINGIWKRMLEYNYLKHISVTVTPKVGSPYTSTIFTVDDNDYLDMGGLYEGCSLKRTKNGPTEAIYVFLGRLIPGRYNGQPIVSGWPSDYNNGFPTLKLISLGSLEQSNGINAITLATDELDGNFYHIECGDLNGDGLDDILIRNTGYYPIVYINDGSGKFKKLDSKFLPNKKYGMSEIYVDLDGDGIKDLLYFPISEYNPERIHPYDANFNGDKTTTVQFKLYKGNRYISSKEFN